MVGRFPLDPLRVAAALRWMLGYDIMIDHLVRQKVSVLSVVSSDFKHHYIDTMLEDLKVSGARSAVQPVTRGICEEMLMNALFNAPLDEYGGRSFATTDRAARVTFPAGKEATMRWSVERDAVTVSMRDGYGSIQVDEIIKSLYQAGGLRLFQRLTAGIGLRMMLTNSQSLMIGVVPGRYTDMTCIIARKRNIEVRPMLAILRSEGAARHQIGDRLWIVERDQRAGHVTLALEGEINETSDLGAIYSGSGEVTLNLQGIKLITSAGIHRWMTARRAMSPALRVTVERCSPALVDQIATLTNLIPIAEIRSIMLPYYCEGCEKDYEQPMDVDRLLAELKSKPCPTWVCPSCGSELEFDRVPESYFYVWQAQ